MRLSGGVFNAVSLSWHCVEKKWRILAIAVFAEVLAEAIWFSFAPFTGPIGSEFGLSIASIGLLASASVWITSPGRMFSGVITDRFGAQRVFSAFLLTIGIFSILSAFSGSFEMLLVTRIFASLSGATVMIGSEHLSEWFTEGHFGLAEGIYAGSGTAGAALSLMFLPRIFGDWNGTLFTAGWRAAFFYLGIIAAITAVIYYLFTDDAPKGGGNREEEAEKASIKSLIYTASRYSVLALAFAYIMSIGVVSAMNSWLPTYFQEAFQSNMATAGMVAAIIPFAHFLMRPVSGHISDFVHERERNLLPVLGDKFRIQWVIISTSITAVSMALLTLAGLQGMTYVKIVLAILGGGTGLVGGAILAAVPELFPERTGTATGVIGGVGTLGGILFPLVFAWTTQIGQIHMGYAYGAAALIPIILLNIYIFGSDTEPDSEKGLMTMSE